MISKNITTQEENKQSRLQYWNALKEMVWVFLQSSKSILKWTTNVALFHLQNEDKHLDIKCLYWEEKKDQPSFPSTRSLWKTVGEQNPERLWHQAKVSSCVTKVEALLAPWIVNGPVAQHRGCFSCYQSHSVYSSAPKPQIQEDALKNMQIQYFGISSDEQRDRLEENPEPRLFC